MARVFLSHSSKQKGFIDVIANKLGKSNIVYDKWTFDAGEKTLDEIYKGIDDTGIFVYFISEESLSSSWVIKEINQALEYLKKGKIKRFLPILIDPNIIHSDTRIPLWIKEEYNINYISKPTKCYDIIKQSLRMASWDLYPEKKEVDQLFIGRTAQIKQFESRIYDVDVPTPVSIIVSGLPSIGRRKFIKHALTNSNKIRSYYEPRLISLDNRNSIEDLIIKLYGLGYSQLTSADVTNLSSKTQSEKVNIVSTLLKELHHNNDIIFILDNQAIVGKDGNIVDWFRPIIESLESLNSIIVCVISQARTRIKSLINLKSVFAIDIPELEPYERKALFKGLLEIEKRTLDPDDFKIIANQFSGFPEQIKYTLQLIQHEGIKYVLEHPNEIVDYNTEKVAKLVKNYESSNLALQILKILSESEFLSFNILEDILQEDFKDAKAIMTQFSNEFIIEYIGDNREFPRLNDSVKDYIQRIGYPLDSKYKENLVNHAKSAFKDYELIDRDISDYVISFKEALKNGLDVPQELLIPSHYVNAMRELYNYNRRYDEVINLAYRILQNEQYLDLRILKEIRYWLCLSLARKRDKRTLEEVQKIEGPDHNFIVGFYYRLVGRHNDAIRKFIEVLDVAPRFYRAKRELVQVYLNTEQFSEAFDLAKDNYYMDKNNPYNLQSYFRCLIKVEGNKNKAELQKLLSELKNNVHNKAPEMYLTAQAQYDAYIDNNENKALNTVNDAINSFPNVIYPYLTKLEILRRGNNINEIEKTLKAIETKFESYSDIYQKLPYLACKCILLYKTGFKEQANKLLNREIKTNFSNSIYSKLSSELRG